MERLRIIKQHFIRFCSDVICLRNFFSIFYLMMVNFTLCMVSFYATMDTQIKSLYGLLGGILFWDILTATTKDHSILYELVTWPIRDFFKTVSVGCLSFALYELKNEEKEGAFLGSTLAVSSLLIDPVYKYHNVNSKILRFLNAFLKKLQNFFISYIVVPLIKLYEWIKYICLFRWVPGLFSYLHNCWVSCYNIIDKCFLNGLRRVLTRAKEFIKYWILFGFWSDLRSWTKSRILNPIIEQFKKIFHAFVYVVGCYWLEPLMKQIARICLRISKRALIMLKNLLQIFGFYVVQPALLILWEQVKLLGNIAYQIAIEPLLKISYKKYKFVEDMIFIYILGPFFKKFMDVLPEKNPFSENTDEELMPFIPSKMTYEVDSDVESVISTNSRLSSNDERQFLPKGIKRIEISGSDTSDLEFDLND